jgi:hypothetical protein
MATNISDLPFNTKTELPSRDIPRETIEHVADPQVTPTYIPPAPKPYIAPQPEHVEPSKIERFIDEFRIPIMISLLYFIYETTAVHTFLVRIAPTLFQENTTGLLVKSACFGILYYAAFMGMEYLSKP